MEDRAKERSLSVEAVAAAAGRGDAEAKRLLVDEGMVLVAQILMMAECGVRRAPRAPPHPPGRCLAERRRRTL